LALLVITAVLVRGLVENDRTSVPQSVPAEGESSEKILYQKESDLTRREDAEEWGKVYSSVAHKAADIGDLSTLHRIKSENPAMLHESDGNGWHPLHFAIRSGRYDAAKFLVENGADVKHNTNHGTAMEIAKDSLHPDDPIVHLLHTVNGNLFGALNGGFPAEL
jgi:ankyrin repeat protein